MAYVKTETQAASTGRVQYAVEYRDPAGRRRRKRCGTLGQAFSFSRRLPFGAASEIKLLVRQKRA
jgi:hypothetical protein